MVVSNCDESTRRSVDAAGHNLLLTYTGSLPMQYGSTGGRESRTFLEGYWMECFPPIIIFSIL